MKIKSLQRKSSKDRSATLSHNFKKVGPALALIPFLFLSFKEARAQDVTGFGYGTYSNINTGNLNYGTISNPFTITYSGAGWATQTLTTYPPVTTPSALSNYVQPANMLELGAFVEGASSIALYTFDSPLPATSVLFIQDVDALESFTIEFLDASGGLLDPGTIGTYNLSNPARSTVAFNSTSITITATDNINYGESLSDFVLNSGLVKQVRVTQIASRDDLAASGTAEFYFAAPSTPSTDPESSLNNPSGSSVTMDLLSGDLLGNGSQATPASVIVNFTAPVGATISGNTITVPGQGEWTYTPATGQITFDPEAGFSGNPTPLTYTLTELATGLTSNISSETVTYLPTLPVDLISFSGKQIGAQISLNWKTANEVNFSHFEVLKRTNSTQEFAAIQKVVGSKQSTYSFTDGAPDEGSNYYKLKMVDLDGTSKFSRIIAISFNRNATLAYNMKQNKNFEELKEINLYPNPVTEVLFMNGVNFSTIKSVEIINALGRVVQTRTSFPNGGMDVTGLPGGTYIAKITSAGGAVSKHTIVVNK